MSSYRKIMFTIGEVTDDDELLVLFTDTKKLSELDSGYYDIDFIVGFTNPEEYEDDNDAIVVVTLKINGELYSTNSKTFVDCIRSVNDWMDSKPDRMCQLIGGTIGRKMSSRNREFLTFLPKVQYGK